MTKILSVLNWNEYQARTDKELPWLKLWGKLFIRPWWQELADSEKVIPIILLDAARRFNNRLPQNPDYYIRNYNLKMGSKKLLSVCNSLKDNGFLSDVMSDCSPSPSCLISEKEKGAEKEKTKFGEDGLVLLTPEEHKKLLVKLGERKTAEYITKANNYIASKGIKYKSHYHTILSWSANEPVGIKPEKKEKRKDPSCTTCDPNGKLSSGVKCWCWK